MVHLQKQCTKLAQELETLTAYEHVFQEDIHKVKMLKDSYEGVYADMQYYYRAVERLLSDYEPYSKKPMCDAWNAYQNQLLQMFNPQSKSVTDCTSYGIGARDTLEFEELRALLSDHMELSVEIMQFTRSESNEQEYLAIVEKCELCCQQLLAQAGHAVQENRQAHSSSASQEYVHSLIGENTNEARLVSDAHNSTQEIIESGLRTTNQVAGSYSQRITTDEGDFIEQGDQAYCNNDESMQQLLGTKTSLVEISKYYDCLLETKKVLMNALNEKRLLRTLQENPGFEKVGYEFMQESASVLREHYEKCLNYQTEAFQLVNILHDEFRYNHDRQQSTNRLKRYEPLWNVTRYALAQYILITAITGCTIVACAITAWLPLSIICSVLTLCWLERTSGMVWYLYSEARTQSQSLDQLLLKIYLLPLRKTAGGVQLALSLIPSFLLGLCSIAGILPTLAVTLARSSWVRVAACMTWFSVCKGMSWLASNKSYYESIDSQLTDKKTDLLSVYNWVTTLDGQSVLSQQLEYHRGEDPVLDTLVTNTREHREKRDRLSNNDKKSLVAYSLFSRTTDMIYWLEGTRERHTVVG